jgi:glucose-6-phosphate-specific signal transduction histidine kinase
LRCWMGYATGTLTLVVSLVVRDDGSGIGDTSRRSGLANLRHRAEAHGGQLRTERAEGGGTRLEWRVPLLAPGLSESSGVAVGTGPR